jgi:uncharacterized protein DUF3306
MAKNDETPERFSLKRWSRRKLDAARNETATPAAAPSHVPPVAPPVAPAPAPSAPDAPRLLPPVETLTFDSDYTAFLAPDVAEPLRQRALRKLFSDPRFNAMDGLDVYIDDYSKPDPLEPDVAKALVDRLFASTQPQPDAQPAASDEVSTKSGPPVQAAGSTPQPGEALPPDSDASQLRVPAADQVRNPDPVQSGERRPDDDRSDSDAPDARTGAHSKPA